METKLSISPTGEKFPIPGQKEYAAEFDRLEKLAKEAKKLQANAVIKIEEGTRGTTFFYTGEAVVFEELPNE